MYKAHYVRAKSYNTSISVHQNHSKHFCCYQKRFPCSYFLLENKSSNIRFKSQLFGNTSLNTIKQTPDSNPNSWCLVAYQVIEHPLNIHQNPWLYLNHQKKNCILLDKIAMLGWRNPPFFPIEIHPPQNRRLLRRIGARGWRF